MPLPLATSAGFLSPSQCRTVSHRNLYSLSVPTRVQKVIIGEGFWKHQRWTPLHLSSPPSLLLGLFMTTLRVVCDFGILLSCLCLWEVNTGPSVSRESPCQVLRFINWVFIMVLWGWKRKGMNVGSQPTSSQLRMMLLEVHWELLGEMAGSQWHVIIDVLLLATTNSKQLWSCRQWCVKHLSDSFLLEWLLSSTVGYRLAFYLLCGFIYLLM